MQLQLKKFGERSKHLSMEMDERMRRQWAAAQDIELAWDGISCLANATGLSRTTI